MTQINNKNAAEYITRFLNGETSREEELALYRFFASGHIPYHLRRYKQMFDWYANGMKTAPEEAAGQQRRFRVKEIYVFWSGVAAVLLLFAGAVFHLTHTFRISHENYRIYEGSYIEYNGRRIEDLRIILPRLQQIETKSEIISQQMDELDCGPYESLHSEAMRLLQEIDNTYSEPIH